MGRCGVLDVLSKELGKKLDVIAAHESAAECRLRPAPDVCLNVRAFVLQMFTLCSARPLDCASRLGDEQNWTGGSWARHHLRTAPVISGLSAMIFLMSTPDDA